MMQQARIAVIISRHFEKRNHLDWQDSFYLATRGGSDSMNLNTGDFLLGREFDALVMNMDAGGIRRLPTPIKPFNLSDRFQRCWNLGDDRNIQQVWVKGSVILDKRESTAKL